MPTSPWPSSAGTPCSPRGQDTLHTEGHGWDVFLTPTYLEDKIMCWDGDAMHWDRRIGPPWLSWRFLPNSSHIPKHLSVL